jgi:hypothetical protein
MDIDRLANLRLAYEELERRVQRALNTQVGDSERLAEAQNEVLLYSRTVEQVSVICPTKRGCDTYPKCSIPNSSHLRSFHIPDKMLCP